jgi:hypothetical protein
MHSLQVVGVRSYSLKNKKSNKNLKIGIAVKYRFIKLVIPFIAQSLLL